jgi:hypothetical protein
MLAAALSPYAAAMANSATSTPTASWLARHPRSAGVGILVALHAIFLALRGLYVGKPEAAVLLLGVLQLFYVVPAVILMLKLGRVELAKGMGLAALATFLANAAGCGAMLVFLSRIEG